VDKIAGGGMIKIAKLEVLIAKTGSYCFHMEVIISILGWIFSFRGIGHGLHSIGYQIH
jgi:hypothetical protein